MSAPTVCGGLDVGANFTGFAGCCGGEVARSPWAAAVTLPVEEKAFLSLAALVEALRPLARVAVMARSTIERPNDFGFDEHIFRHVGAPVATFIEHLVLAGVAAFRCLLFLALSTHQCNANLPAVDAFGSFEARTLGDPNIPGHLYLSIATARRRCLREVPFVHVTHHLSASIANLELLVDAFVVRLLNKYFVRDRNIIGGFVLSTDNRQESRRALLLASLLKSVGCLTRRCDFVEVGVLAAETSAHLLSVLPLLHVHGVDPYEPSKEYPHVDSTFPAARAIYSKFKPRACLHRNVSRDVAPKLRSLDLVFIDGSHRYADVLDDLRVWSPKSKRIAGHDLNLMNGDVARALFEWSAGRILNVLPDSMWYVDLQ